MTMQLESLADGYMHVHDDILFALERVVVF